MSNTTPKKGANKLVQDGSKRDFMIFAANGMAVVGAASAAWPFIDSMNPAADVLSLASTEVDISSVEPGAGVSVLWRGKPIFIRRRTATELKEIREVDITTIPDPESDSDRVKKGKEEWLVVIGSCTHLGCVPIKNSGEYGGWFCPCHGSHYDVSGRIRKGPAPKNLFIPPYKFIDQNTILIG